MGRRKDMSKDPVEHDAPNAAYAQGREPINVPADGVFITEENVFITAHGQFIGAPHARTADCDEFGCVIHNQTDHHMRGLPTLWRSDRMIMERICEHGVGHLDPDNMAYFDRTRPDGHSESIHGCCTELCCASGETQALWHMYKRERNIEQNADNKKEQS